MTFHAPCGISRLPHISAGGGCQKPADLCKTAVHVCATSFRLTHWPTCSTGRSLRGVSSKPWGVSTWLMAPLSVFHTTRRPSDPEVTSIVVPCTGVTGMTQRWTAVQHSILRHQAPMSWAAPQRGHISSSRSTTKRPWQARVSAAGALPHQQLLLLKPQTHCTVWGDVASAGRLWRWQMPMLWSPHSSLMALLQGSPP